MKKLLWLPFLLLIANCSTCDENLQRICPKPEPCWVTEDGELVLGKALHKYRDKTIGECSFGETACDFKLDVYCRGIKNPKAEICDYKDNNCNGLIDEGFDNDKDSFRQCAGDCDDSDADVYPNNIEVCDGKDNDCDGLIDEIEPKECFTGPDETIFANTPCQTGLTFCENGSWSVCHGEVVPTEEMCDLVDNDCDGVIDNNVPAVSCGPPTNYGQCDYGRTICVDGETYCIDADYGQFEICDNIDNDCDLKKDEDLDGNPLKRNCETLCEQGFETCQAGFWVNCTARQPTIEICDNIDNDCDGEIDEGCLCIEDDVRICRNNIFNPATGNTINCGIGVQICDIFGTWGPCYFLTEEEETCNNWDDDCDGLIDGMTINCGVPETANIGECKLGEATCTYGIWSECLGNIDPEEEICDQKDNDCDGEIDEDLDPNEKVDMVFAIDISGSMIPYINALKTGILNYVSAFDNSDHRFALLTYPKTPPGGLTIANMIEFRTSPPLVDYTTFSSAVSLLTTNGGSLEPTYNVLFSLTDPTDPLGVGWRSDAHPYIVIITDEPAQSTQWQPVTESAIAQQTINCQVGNCEAGDRWEVYIITNLIYMVSYDTIVYGDIDRLISISPADPGYYTQILQNIFQNICINPS
jgi:hypothetical protein